MLRDVLIVVAVVMALYVAALVALVVAGRRADMVAAARLVPDCAVLVRRLLRDPRVPVRHKLLLLALLGYLASPIDLVPDFLPVAGHIDDALVVLFVLRRLVRGAGPGIVRELWPGPERSVATLLRLAQYPGG